MQVSDLNSFRPIIKNDTVDGFLNEFRSDIVYRLFDKTRSLFIYILFEHKSSPDKRTIIQLIILTLSKTISLNRKNMKVPYSL